MSLDPSAISGVITTTPQDDSVTGAKLANSAVLRNVCQGRLTLTSGTAVTTSDVTAATTWYFTPHKGNQVTLFVGGRWELYEFSERSLAVVASTDTNYDLFLYDNSGTLTLESVAWTNDTTRATAIVLQDGIYCKSGALDRRYLGTVRTTGTSGQCEDSESRRFVWNYYNRVNRSLVAQTVTSNWSYTTATWHAANSDTSLGVTRVACVIGVQEDELACKVSASAENSTDAIQVAVGLGISSTTVNSAQLFGTLVSPRAPVVAEYSGHPALGYFYLQWLEISQTGGTTTWFGTQATTYLQSGVLGVLQA